MPIDIEGTLIDIKALIEREAGIRLTKHSNSKDGPEYHGSCPWCGGRDRFLVTPQIGRYSCAIRSSGCGRYGDAIDFLRNYPYENAMTYVEACDELGLDVDPAYRVFKFPAEQRDDTSSPPKEWQETGMSLLKQAEHALWNHPEGLKLVEYLHRRGLNDGILKQKRLGYIPLQKTGRMSEMPFDAWGLTQEMVSAEQWAKGCVRIPDGLLMPWFVGGNLWKLTVKRPFVGEDEMGYGQILGSQECLYNVDLITKELPAMMTESVIDALSVEQDAGDLIIVVATDSASRTRQARWIASLCKASYVLQSFDTDDPGERGATEWLDLLPESHVMRHEPWAHDPNDMLREGQDIRKWVKVGIHLYQSPTMPLSTTTVDWFLINREDHPPLQGEYTSINDPGEILTEDIPLCSECVSDGWDVAGTHADNEGIWHCQRHWNEADLLDTMNTFIDKLKPSLPGQWIVSEPMRCTPAQYIEQRKAEMDADADADADRRLLDDLLAKIPRDAYMWWHVPGSGYPDAYISVTPYIKQLRSCIESGDIVKRRGARLDIKRRLSGPTPIDYLQARKERQIQAVPHRTPDMYWSELRRQLSKKDKDTGMSYYDMVDRDTVLLQARINAYREKWQLGEPISLSVAHMSEDTTDIPIEDEEHGHPSQQTTDECANTFAHVVSPSLTRDTSGNFWCDACSRQRVLMNDGKRMGFPPLSLRNNPPIPSGYEEWIVFARTSGDDILELALDITFEKKKVAA